MQGKAECFGRAINTAGRLHRTNNQSGLKRTEEASSSFDNLIYRPVGQTVPENEQSRGDNTVTLFRKAAVAEAVF